MADKPVIINNPPQANGNGGGSGFLIGIVLLIIAVFFFFYYGLPLLRQGFQTPQITVPDKIDVNINQGK